MKEKDTVKYDKGEIRQKDALEIVDAETKESGIAKMEETRRYIFVVLFWCSRTCLMVTVTSQFVVVCLTCTCEYSNIHFLMTS